MGNTSDSLKGDRRSDLDTFLSSGNGNSKKIGNLSKEDFSLPFTHKKRIICFICDSQRDYLYSGGLDKTICCWSSISGTIIKTLTGHSDLISCLALDSQGTLYSGSYDRNIICWDIKNGKPISKMAKSKNWITCLVVNEGFLFAGSVDHTIQCYSVKSRKVVSIFHGHKMSVEDLKIDENERLLYSSSLDGTVRVWNMDSGKCIKVFSNYKDDFVNLFQFRGGSRGKKQNLNIGLYNNNLFCKVGDEGVHWWDIETEKKVSNRFSQISAFSIKGRVFTGWNISRKLFEIWDMEKNKLVQEIPCDMITTSNIELFKNHIFYSLGNVIHKQRLKPGKKLNKQEEGYSNHNYRLKYFQLYNYYEKVLKRSTKDVTQVIDKLYENGSLEKCETFDQQLECVSKFLLQNAEIMKPLEKKKEKIDPKNDTINFSIFFGKDIDPLFEKKAIEEDEPHGYNKDFVYPKEQLEYDLETKTQIFYQHVLNKSTELQPTVMVVRRDNLVFDACKHLTVLKNSDFRKPWYLFFASEEALDTGGVTREFYYLISKQIVNPDYALFELKSSNTYHPNPASGVNTSHLQYFSFIGKLVGKAIYDMQMIDLHFSKIMFKLMCGESIEFDDLEKVEPILYSSLKKLLVMKKVESLELYFQADINDFGLNNSRDLIEGGAKILVTDENKEKFVTSYARWFLLDSVKPQLEKFLDGLFSVIPRQYFQLFSAEELELLLCGSEKMDVKDWRANTIYEGYKIDDNAVLIFWSTLELMEKIEQAELLQFVTGTSCIPVEGFSGLTPKFSVCKLHDGTRKHFPLVHTCMNRIEIPEYKNEEECYEKIMKAIEYGKRFDRV